MSSSPVDVLIVGGGLSGLTAAYRLLQTDPSLKVTVAEARSRIGGRTYNIGDFDVGGAWCWAPHNPFLTKLAKELGVNKFVQPGAGLDAVYQMSETTAQRGRVSGMDDPNQFRFADGAFAISNALADKVEELGGKIATNAAVTAIDSSGGDGPSITLTATDDTNTISKLSARAVILAAPPRAVLAHVQFQPPIDPALVRGYQSQPTWMGNTAKVVFEYENRWWHEEGLSGGGMSRVGPVVQLYDASTEDGKSTAICGFIFGVTEYLDGAHVTEDAVAKLKEQAVHQMGVLFGDSARSPRAVHFHDWSSNKWTIPDRTDPGPGHHPHPRDFFLKPITPDSSIIWAGAEASQHHAGLLDGAVDAGEHAATKIAKRLSSSQ